MNFASVQREVSEEVLNNFNQIKRILEYLREFEIGRNGYEGNLTATSHILCGAFDDAMGLESKSGMFAKEHKHYWLATSHGFIIDILPIGIYGGPILVDPILNHLYKETKLNDFSHMQYDVHIKKVALAISQFLKNHP